MICPHCGKETTEQHAQCPHCGAPLSQGANWGVRKSSNTYRPQYSSDTEKLTSYVAVTPALHKAKPQGLKIAAGVLAIALVAAVGVGGFMMAQQNAPEEPTQATSSAAPTPKKSATYNINLGVKAYGLDNRGTPIPIQVSGADNSGNGYNEIMFIDAEGTGIQLPAGKYGVCPAASPITADGGLFLYNTQNKWFTVDAEAAQSSTIDLSEEIQIVLEPADPNDITNDMIDAAKQYAVESGRSAEDIDALLRATQASIEEARQGQAFSSVQTYRNITFAGDVRTNTGFIPASGIPNVNQMLTRTNMFLFTSNTLYYADNAAGESYTTQIALHARNMTTGQESILATDLASQTIPYYTNGQILYTAYENGRSIKRIKISSNETDSLSERLSWEFSKLVGVQEKNAVIATSDNELPRLAILPLDEGEATIVSLGDTYGTVVGIYDDTVLVSLPEWSSTRLVAYSLDGTQLWESEIPDGATLGSQVFYEKGRLYAPNSSNSLIMRVDMSSGKIRNFSIDMPYFYNIMLVKDNHLYFAGSQNYTSYDEDGNAISTYTTYDLNLDSGRVNELGSYAAPQDEDLIQQQDIWNWDSTWSNTNTWGTTNTDQTNTWDTTGIDTTGTEWGSGTDDATGVDIGWSDATTTDTTTTDTTTTGGDGSNPEYGDWDANGAFVGNGQGGYNANGEPVS